MAKVALSDIADIDAVVGDRARLNVVEAVDEVGDRRLARARRTDEGDLLPGLCVEGDVVEHRLALLIAERDAVEADIALQQYEVMACGAAVGHLPCPELAVLPLFVPIFARLRHPDERHVAALVLGHGVEHLKDALCARERLHDGVELLGDLLDGHIEGAHEVEEGDDGAERQRSAKALREAVDGERVPSAFHDEERRHERHDDILDIADVVGDGPDDVGEHVRLGRVDAQVLVEGAEGSLCLFLVIEHFDDALAAHHLLDIAVDGSERALLLQKVPAAALCELLREEEHAYDEDHGDKRQRRGIEHHHAESADDGHRRVDELRDGLREHLTEHIGIVRITAHERAVRVRIEEL